METNAESDAPNIQRSKLTADLIERAISICILAGVCGILVWGWLSRSTLPIDPENGLGYSLGIIGGTMMLVLLGYPLRKRVRSTTRASGTVGFWFRLHMLLGLMGPLAILFHSRFSWGALNSAVALGTMIVVASSGLIGRFFYARVYRGYSDRKLELRGLKLEMEELLTRLKMRGVLKSEFLDRMHTFEDRAIMAGSAFWTSAGAVLGLSVETRVACYSLGREFTRSGSQSVEVRVLLHDYFRAVRRAAEFAFFDRLLRLWHLLHLPLFFLLVAAAILHIVAVHMY